MVQIEYNPSSVSECRIKRSKAGIKSKVATSRHKLIFLRKRMKMTGFIQKLCSRKTKNQSVKRKKCHMIQNKFIYQKIKNNFDSKSLL